MCIDSEGEILIHPITVEDWNHIIVNHAGDVTIQCNEERDCDVPIDLLGPGHHFDDVPRQQHHAQVTQNNSCDLPQQQMLVTMINSNAMRPVDNHRWT